MKACGVQVGWGPGGGGGGGAVVTDRINTLAMKVSREGACTVSCRGRAFQSFTVLGKKEHCLRSGAAGVLSVGPVVSSEVKRR